MSDLGLIQVRPILESLAYIQEQGASVARFGDGEVELMTGSSIPYQDYDPDLAQALLEILTTPSRADFGSIISCVESLLSMQLFL
ncbi:DUF1792 domain-containing protein [Streptococcus danieliae]|uniref:DUF1792 domain-containing protein n=1 Tax=Streptococcus danieliae TaxID=747656 RepID=A0A7X3G9D2_9STRE|nr:GT-D fold domain-containing glycosyltransferase [Streptococcus danieliae]MVX59538.1 DUF1792 domain-containing protein [Streptococcus danieliae]